MGTAIHNENYTGRYERYRVTINTTASSTYDGQQHVCCVRYRAAAAIVQLWYEATEMYSCSRGATAAAVTAPFYGAALLAVAYSLSCKSHGLLLASAASGLIGKESLAFGHRSLFSGHGVWSARFQFLDTESLSPPPPLHYAPIKASRRPAAIQTAGVAPRIDLLTYTFPPWRARLVPGLS